MPNEDDLLPGSTRDGGTWTQSFAYADLAHVVIPATFSWEKFEAGAFSRGYKTQDIQRLSQELNKLAIAHRCTERVLEIKLY